MRLPLALSSREGGFGLTHRSSMATWWGGGAVIVRAGESLVHGEGPQQIEVADQKGSETLVNIGEPRWPALSEAVVRVRQMQIKLHRWAVEDLDRRFDDVFNLVHHPDFLTVAWERVSGNKGARTAGVDRVRPTEIAESGEAVRFLEMVREQLKSRTFAPLPVRERLIPKPGSSKLRRLGIPTAMDRVVQASLMLVLEPIFEADFKPVSYGFRPGRRAQDAIAEIHAFGSRGYHWVFEADIAACFDEISHSALMGRVRARIADKRVLDLIKAFLTSGIMSANRQVKRSDTGTPQGGIISPLLANIALSVLDEHFCAKWDAHGSWYRRNSHRKRGGATYRIVRYADDFVIMVSGSKAHADALWDEVAELIAPLGLRLSVAKSRVCHLDEGLVFLGFHIQRRHKKGTSSMKVYTYPSKKALLSITTKVRALTNKAQHHGLADLLGRLNPVLRGWCMYFRHGVSKATFGYLDAFAWRRVTRWLRKRHPRITWTDLYRRFLTARPGNRPQEDGIAMFDTTTVAVTRYRWRASNIPTPWSSNAGTLVPA
jgi:RNA-directed DNA polymerase